MSMSSSSSDLFDHYQRKYHALKIPPCDPGYFECDSGDYCVKQQFNCDDNEDCPDGSDESNCTDKYDSSYYNKLFSKRPDEDREKLTINCSLTMIPAICTCSGMGIFCVNRNLHDVPRKDLPKKMNVLDLSGNQISIIKNTTFTRRLRHLKSLILTSNNIHTLQSDAFGNLTELTHLHLIGNQLEVIVDFVFHKNKKLRLLNLSYNPIRMIGLNAFNGLNGLIELDLRACQLIRLPARQFFPLNQLQILWLQQNRIWFINNDALVHLNNLDTLSLAHNQLSELNEAIFIDLIRLKSLSLAYNKLTFITENQLNQMTSLAKLDLSFNQIVTIQSHAFNNMLQLRSLALQGNRFQKLPQDIFNELKELTHIYFSDFRHCTYALNVRVCIPRGDGISSVQHLLDSVILRIAVWIVAMIALIGNCLVIIGRMMMHELNVVHSFFIKNLAMADLLMGIYLFIIAYYDIKFRNHYILYEEEWRMSWQCTFAGIISTISSESSVFILAIITIDRYLSVMHPFSIKRHSMSFAIGAMFMVWALSIILALLPLIAKRYFTNRFYGNNGVCLGLQLHDGTGIGYSTFLFCGVNSIVFLFIMHAYMKMSMAIMNSAIGLRTTQQHDRNIAKRCAFIVATDGICWLPIVLIKLAAISGIPINQDLYAWVAVFLLPVNSALNPVLYTLTTKLFKQHLNRFITHNFSSQNRHTPPMMDHSSGSSSFCSLNHNHINHIKENRDSDPSIHLNLKNNLATVDLHHYHHNNNQRYHHCQHHHCHHHHHHHHHNCHRTSTSSNNVTNNRSFPNRFNSKRSVMTILSDGSPAYTTGPSPTHTDQNIGGTMEIVRLEQLFENNKNDTSQTATDDNGSNVANNNHQQQQQQQKNKITVNPLSLEKQNETTEIESGRKKDVAKLSDDHSLL
nr:relaxin receptor 2-like [Dermatophagoides farinae]